MKIAVTASEKSMKGLITKRVAESSQLMVIDIDEETLQANIIKSVDITEKREDAIGLVTAEDCEAIISGVLEDSDFDALANQQITRYNGVGLSVEKALRDMNTGQLTLFTRSENEDENEGHTHTCDHGEE